MARYLGFPSPHCYEYLSQFIHHMINDERIKKTVIKKIKDYNKLINSVNEQKQYYLALAVLEQKIETLSEKSKAKRLIQKELLVLCAQLTIVNNDLIELFSKITEATDLKDITIPSEEILAPEKHKFYISQQRGGGGFDRRRSNPNEFEIK